jgi:L-fuconolactonase
MYIVDSHAHASPDWGEPVESLLFHMDAAGVERAVLQQMMNGAANNAYLSECARRYPDRLVFVAFVAPGPDARRDVLKALDMGAVGLRLPPRRVYRDRDISELWLLAREFGLPVSCGGGLREFASDKFADLLATVRGIPVVIEHMGGRPLEPDDSPFLRAKAYELSRFPDVFLKLGAPGIFLRHSDPFDPAHPYAGPVPAYYQMALESFGPARLLWGSDYSPVSAREGYAGALRSVREQLGGLPEDALELIFGQVAGSVFVPRTHH